jgi:hydroxymethylpyrimidine pyrophosphatase-like HAD family hydrolase
VAGMDWPIRLASTDFDGTLFCEFEDPPFPNELAEVLAEFQAAGGKWAINTGRDLASLLEELARCGVSVQPDFIVAVEREIHIRDGSQFKPHAEWNAECNAKHKDLTRELDDELPVIVSWIRNHSRASVFSDIYSPLAVVATNNAEMDDVQARVLQMTDSFKNLAWMRNDVYARICHADYSKGTALMELERMMGIGPEDVFAIGDHLNDLGMLDPAVAAYLAAPANCVPEVSAHILANDGRISEFSHGLAVANELTWLKSNG